MARRRPDALLELAELVAPRAKRVRADVAAALVDPDGFFAKHADAFAERNIDTPIRELPWFSLIDAAIAARWCAGIDWKCALEDFTGAITRLRSCPRGAFASWKAADLDERSTWELLELAGEHVATHDLALASLDTSSDEYNLVLVPTDRIADAIRLAREAGFGTIERFTGAKLAAATRERRAAEKRHAKRIAKPPAEKFPFTLFARGKESWWIRVAGSTYDAGYEKPRVKFVEMHTFPSPAAARAAAATRIAAWKADGFRGVTQAAFDALPHADGAYIGWRGPFPRDATYWMEGKIVRCYALRGATIVETSGYLPNREFGELLRIHHFSTTDAAAERFTTLCAGRKPIARAAVAKKYGVS